MDKKDYSNAFYFSGLCLILSAVFVAVVDHLVRRKNSVRTEGHQMINQRTRIPDGEGYLCLPCGVSGDVPGRCSSDAFYEGKFSKK